MTKAHISAAALAGFGVGWFASYLVSRVMYERLANAEMEKAVATFEAREAALKLALQKYQISEKTQKETPAKTQEEFKEEIRELAKNVSVTKIETEPVDYTSISKREDENVTSTIGVFAEFVTEDQYDNEYLDHQKLYAVLYSDGTLADGNNTIIEGYAWLSEAVDAFATDDTDETWVRHLGSGMDVHIVKNDDPYSSVVYSDWFEDETPDPPAKKHKKLKYPQDEDDV